MIWNYVQDGVDLQKILQFVKKTPTDNVYIISDTEWNFDSQYKHLIPEINQYTKINYLFGSYDCEWYKINHSYANITYWNTFWFNWTEMCLRTKYDYQNANYQNFIHPYICLNNKSNVLRCSLVDNLARLNYVDKGNLTWNKFIDNKDGFQFKFYDDSFRSLDDDFFRKQDSFIICKEFYTSLFHIIGESTNHVPFITEKTVIPILMKKPFVSFGCKGFNKKLKDLGFELFDEVVDYSFDELENVRERGQVLTDSLFDLIYCNNLNLLYKKLYPKIEHNFNQALRIIKTRNFIPSLVQERVSHLMSINTFKSPVEGRWENFIRDSY